MLAWTPVAQAQRAAENAVTTATDAFGTSVGREEIGLYDSGRVRGFSPTAAGNVRIEGLYFDQVWGLNSRVRAATAIRVGPATIGYPFPAPTGIVDYVFRRPGDAHATSVLVAADEWGGASLEIDATLPLSRAVSIGIGAAYFADESGAGNDGRYANAAAIARWRPAIGTELIAFAARSEGRDDEAAPIYVPAGPYLPPRLPRRRFDGPGWTQYRGAAENYGLLGQAPLAGWTLEIGAFRSAFDDDATYTNLVVDQAVDGVGRRLIVADPPTLTASISGEARAVREFTAGDATHRAVLSVRPRSRLSRFDGADVADLGPAIPGELVATPRPTFAFGPQTRDRVRQTTWGVGYEWRARQGFQLGAGVQRARYSKRVARPDGVAATRSDPWLYNVSAAARLTSALSVYASHARGLEESGVAPGSAVNRNEALPAIVTRQVDGGLRFRPSDTLSLVAGVFEVRKPYFELDERNRYGELGAVAHRGLELSVTTTPTRGLTLVGGVVALDPRVRGDAVALGRVARRPVGQPRMLAQLSADWQVPRATRWSIDATVTHTGTMPATRDAAVSLPARTIVDVGGRLRFTLRAHAATLRLSVANLGNTFGYDVLGSGVYAPIDGRRASLYLTVDR